MLLNLNDISEGYDISEAATIADFTRLHPWLNASGANRWKFDANGASVTTSTSSGMYILVGGNPTQQRVVCEMKYIAPNGPADAEIYVMNRVITAKSPTDGESNVVNYYWAGFYNGVFRIRRTLNGSSSTIASTAYNLPVNTWATITLQYVGSVITASIDDGSTQAQLSLENTDIIGAGIAGFRSGFSAACTISVRAWQVTDIF